MSPIGIRGSAQRFTEFASRQLTTLFKFMPTMASSMGLHAYDGMVPDFTKENIEARVEELNRALAELEEIDPADFDADLNLDYHLLRQGLQTERFRLGELREHTYNPLFIFWMVDVMNYIKRDYAPPEERITKLVEYELQVPKLIEQTKAALELPLAHPHLQIAIQMCTGQVKYMREDFPRTVAEQLGEHEPLLAEFNEANGKAVEALESYLNFLTEQMPHARPDFGIGAEMFSRMLAVNELVDLPLEYILEVGRANLEANKAAYIETAHEIEPAMDVREVALMMSTDHPTKETLIPDAADMLEELRDFIIESDLVTVPSEVRCKVVETPPFLRWGFAFMDSPGPFEEKATDAYYYVTPVEEEWTEQQAEEWLRRFNYASLCDVSIHEAYPGHYLHFLHASARVTSPVRKVFGSYSFVEGWAHYCEQMMVEEGYRGDTPVLRFAQLSEALLRNCRYVAAIMMHTGRMTLDEATRFFMENGFMDELPAQKEALRGTFDPGYLNYTLGKLLILKLRDDLKAKEGDSFNLKRFHDSMLALGYPPVPLVRQYLLGDDNSPIL
ncbi:MAG TPA: DUF885 domain-containing protein [Chloroflexia bacterium]|nr:DUF885 domain-containing protein [Chloroflexia bacterium]